MWKVMDPSWCVCFPNTCLFTSVRGRRVGGGLPASVPASPCTAWPPCAAFVFEVYLQFMSLCYLLVFLARYGNLCCFGVLE